MNENLNQTETQSETEKTSAGNEEAEQPLSLRDELAKQLTKQTEEVTEDADTSSENSESSEESNAEGDSEESGEKAKEEVAEEKTEEVSDSDIPNNWNAEEKKAFEEIPDEITAQDGTTISLKAMKDVVLHRNEELLKAFNEKAREASTAKKGSEDWNNLLDPYKPQLTATGQTAQQWIGSILQSVHKLQADPKVVIKELIDTYKVSATDLGIKTEQSEDEDSFHGENDPKVTKLETTIDTLQKRLDSFENTNIQQKNQSVQDEIVTFKGQTDTKGNLTHPHFDEARDEMGLLMQTGKAKTMQEAYDKSPTVRSNGLKVVNSPEDNKAALKKAREEAAKAKKAGKTVKTRSGTPSDPLKGLSLRDTLKVRYRGQQ